MTFFKKLADTMFGDGIKDLSDKELENMRIAQKMIDKNKEKLEKQLERSSQNSYVRKDN